MDRDLRLIEEQHPLIHNITNYVAMNFVANSLLAIGASPIMSRAQEEVEEICSKSNALALNLGILENATAHSMLLAGEAASKSRIPIVLDVVGVGATRFRMDTASMPANCYQGKCQRDTIIILSSDRNAGSGQPSGNL